MQGGDGCAERDAHGALDWDQGVPGWLGPLCGTGALRAVGPIGEDIAKRGRGEGLGCGPPRARPAPRPDPRLHHPDLRHGPRVLEVTEMLDHPRHERSYFVHKREVIHDSRTDQVIFVAWNTLHQRRVNIYRPQYHRLLRSEPYEAFIEETAIIRPECKPASVFGLNSVALPVVLRNIVTVYLSPAELNTEKAQRDLLAEASRQYARKFKEKDLLHATITKYYSTIRDVAANKRFRFL